MTIDEAKDFMWKENNKAPSTIKWGHHQTIRLLHEELIDKIYDDFDKQLKEAYIKGSDDCFMALKNSGKLKE